MVELRTHLQPKGQDRTSLHLRVSAPVPYPTISGGAAGNVYYGGTANPPATERAGPDKPPPTVARASVLPDHGSYLGQGIVVVLDEMSNLYY